MLEKVKNQGGFGDDANDVVFAGHGSRQGDWPSQ